MTKSKLVPAVLKKPEKAKVVTEDAFKAVAAKAPALPPIPDFIKENLPRFNPAAPSAGLTPIRKQPNLLEAYFKGDVSLIVQDAAHRPQHYAPHEHALLQLLKAKKELPRGVGDREVNELVLRYNEKTKPAAKPPEKKVEKHSDPSVQRAIDKADRQRDEASFEAQNFPKSIRII